MFIREHSGTSVLACEDHDIRGHTLIVLSPVITALKGVQKTVNNKSETIVKLDK